jgi:tRNA-specific 2-thiouridylase
MWKHVQAMGAEKMATGHYARLRVANNKTVKLLKGLDENKDQSYVLSVLRQDQLQHTLLPIGELTKPQVRQLARDFGLPVAERQDSQDLCFLAGQDYRDFLRRNGPDVIRPGKIVTTGGQVVGEHEGLGFYTIGQRKGLGLQSTRPYYVIDKRVEENLLIVGEESDLRFGGLIAEGVNWIEGTPPTPRFSAEVKIRYKARFTPAIIEIMDGHTVCVQFEQPVRDVTPGQRAVFYRGEEVIGGGMIRKAIPLNNQGKA